VTGSGPWLFPQTDAEPFDYDEFVLRVAKGEGVDQTTAELQVLNRLVGVFSSAP